MKLNFILLLTIIRFLKADDLALCSSSYCSTAECQTVSDKCTNDSYAQEVVSLPSPDTCNCCTYCLENIEEGGECAVGSAGAPIPTSICGPGLTCDSTTKTCIQKTDTPCTQAQQVYDQKKQNGTLGMLETRPLCDSDGYYDTYKCIPGQNCFCVDKTGDRIFGEIAYTETPSYFLECQCSRKLQEAVELIGRDLHPNEFFRCLDNGDFDQLQCIDDLCFCVDNSDGALTYPKSPSVNITQISNTTLDCFDEKIHKTGEFYTSCALEYVEMAEQVDAYMSQGFDLGFDFKFPNCTPDGKYAPVQQTTNTIYCANPDGELIENYSISTGDSKASGMDCTLGIIPTIQEHDEYVEKNTQISTDVRPYSEIPGPKGLPLLGNSWRFAPIIGHYKIDELDKVMWSLFKDYGRIVKVGGLIGHPDLLFVFNGDDIRKVFKREERMPHRPSMPSLHYYKQHLKKDFFQDNPGVIGVHGPKWEQFRKQVQHILLQPQIARTYVTPLDQIAGDFIARMEEMLDNRKELPDNFLSEIYKWALESVAMVSLDARLGCLQSNLNENSEPQQIINSINTFFWNVAKVELKMPIWRVYKNKAFRDYIGALEDFRMLCLKHINNTMEIMRKRNNKNENISIVERILLKTDDPKLAAILALDLLLVGVDTTSIATASTIYQLTQNQDKQEILYEDLRKLLPTPESPINNEILEKTTYLKACIRETLRLYPVIIGNGRSLQSDMIIGGYNVPKGTHVIFPHLVVSHSHEYFDKPEKFLPERWLNNDGIECPKHNRIHPFVSLPFGYGRRSCLGRRFAEMELQIFLAKLFRKYKIEYHYQPLTYKITPTYVPEQPLKFRLIERK